MLAKCNKKQIVYNVTKCLKWNTKKCPVAINFREHSCLLVYWKILQAVVAKQYFPLNIACSKNYNSYLLLTQNAYFVTMSYHAVLFNTLDIKNYLNSIDNTSVCTWRTYIGEHHTIHLTFNFDSSTSVNVEKFLHDFHDVKVMLNRN